jgi:glycosyltransferase involved in cell wall biosynthesis
MKIIFFIADLENGGQERQLTYLLKSIISLNHEVKVIVWHERENGYYNKAIREMGIEIISITCAIKGVFSKLCFIKKVIKNEKPDILQSFSYYLNFYSYVLTAFTHTKPIGIIRSGMELYRRQTIFPVYLLCTIFPLRFISNNFSFNDCKVFPFQRLYLKKRTVVIPNALQAALFPERRNQNNSNQNSYISVSVGRLVKEKRIDLMIKIHKRLLEMGINIIHFHAGEGDYSDELKELIINSDLKDTFILSGVKKDIPHFLGQADIFIHTSDFEGSPNAVMEAMAAGLPIVTSNCGDVRFFLENDFGGYILPTGHWEEIAQKTADLLGNHLLRQQMGEHNAKLSRTIFSVSNMTEKYISTYENILD